MKQKSILIATFITVGLFTTGTFATDTVTTAPATTETTTAVVAPTVTEPTNTATNPVAPQLTEAQINAAAILELTNAIALSEAKVAELKAKLADTTVILTAEEKLAIQNELTTLQKTLDLNYSKLAALQTPTVDEKLALEAKATELKTKIAELEKQLKSGATTLSKAEIDKLKADIAALKAELTKINSTLGIEDSKNPNQARFEMAKKLGITPGKMRLLEKLMTMLGVEIDLKEWATMGVKDINKEVKDERKSKDESKAKAALMHNKNAEKEKSKNVMENKKEKENLSEKEIKSHENGKGKKK